MLWEAMVAEVRAVQLDLHARATFARDGDQIQDTRGALADLFRPAPTAQEISTRLARSGARLSAAAAGGFVEVG